jgi:hypothetical protein
MKIYGKVLGWNGKRFVCYYYFIHWSVISLGISISLNGPNVEIHLPFGFIRIGFRSQWR